MTAAPNTKLAIPTVMVKVDGYPVQTARTVQVTVGQMTLTLWATADGAVVVQGDCRLLVAPQAANFVHIVDGDSRK